MHLGNDTDVIRPNRNQGAVGEASTELPSHGSDQSRACLRKLDDTGDADLDRINERGTEPGALSLDVLRGFQELGLGEPLEGRRTCHPKRARAPRYTSWAGVPNAPLRSHAASRRAASSTHRSVFSASESSSRLALSFSARRVRICGSSSRTSAFSWSMRVTEPQLVPTCWQRHPGCRPSRTALGRSPPQPRVGGAYAHESRRRR